MYLAPDGDEIGIADAAATFLAEAMPIARLHTVGSSDMQAPLRAALGDMGWFALAVPEADGGSGLGPVEHALFFREAGRQCGPIDLLSQCLAATAAADPALRAAFISGGTGAALIVPDSDHWRILGAADAAYGLRVTRDGAHLYPLADLNARHRPALDPANSLRLVESLPEPCSSSESGQTWRLGQLGTAAMLVGIAEAALDLIVDYAKMREAFNRKIGAFQAVRHPCADMATRVEAARAQLWYAAAALNEGRSDADVHLDAAKHMANQAAMANADTNIQLHGGIGVTDDHNAHLLLKHAMVLSRLFGTKRSLLDRLLNARLED